MIRRLMASTAMLALLTTGAVSIAQAQEATEQPAVVQDQTTEQPAATEPAAEVDATADATAGAAEETLTPEEPTIATAFIGTSVYSSEDPESDNIGEVNDLIIGDNGMITHAVVGVGGFLGIGEKDVAVPFEELQVVEQDGDIRLIYAATREQLEAAEQFDRTAYDPRGRAAEEQAAQDTAMAPDAGMAPAPLEEPAAPAENVAEAPATEEPAADAAATEDMAAAPATEEPAADAAATEDMAAAPATEEPAADAAATEDLAATEEPAADAAATEDMAAAPATDDEAFIAFAPEQIRASTLIGQEVFGSDGESIGEVSDLILQDDGETRAAIVDVGGFLGIGEKPVAISFDQLQFAQDGDQQQVTVAYAQADLEGLPTYEYPAEDVAATEPATDATAETDVAVDATAEQPAADAEGAAMTGSGFAPITQDFSANELLGAIVYGSGDENIGEVNDVVFDQSGAIDAVLVDVGGFLGAGEKQVALNFDSLNVQQDADGNVELQVNATQEQLEGAAAYEVVAQ